MYEDLKKQLQDYAAGTMRDDDAEIAFDALNAIEKLEHKVFILEGDREGLLAQIPSWIPVSERLPELNAPCLLYNESQPMMVGWRIDDKRFRIPGSFLPDHPTHWMPLPQPPGEETI